MCWDFQGDQMKKCMTFDGYSTRYCLIHICSENSIEGFLRENRDLFMTMALCVQRIIQFMEVEGTQIQGHLNNLSTINGIGRLNSIIRIQISITHPNIFRLEDGLKDASCITVEEGVLFLGFGRIGTYLFNTYKQSWSF